jgi:hypothetical protein
MFVRFRKTRRKLQASLVETRRADGKVRHDGAKSCRSRIPLYVCHYIMFVRFRKTRRKLQASLVETRRADGKVRHEHIASFGSVEVPPSIAERLAFWRRLHQRLATLANRVDDAARGKILGDIQARIPMVTLDEQRQLT